ncbi:unnamed protein product [Mucor hiemalis]
MAGFSIRDSNISLPVAITSKNMKEYRGLAYTVGGGKGASTLPNYIKHYQSNLTGYSTGEHPPEYCFLDDCNAKYIPELDMLNAAQSGAIAYRIDGELTYLIERMRSMENIDFENDWKMISIQIGGNDQCQSCLHPDMYSPENYELHVDAAIQRIQATIPKIVNNNQCIGPGAVSKYHHCPCAQGEENMEKIKILGNEYNNRLEKIYRKYQEKKSDSFAVIYQKLSVNFESCSDDYFSNFDCFHASTVGQNFIARVLWNQLYLSQADKPTNSIFSYDEPLYCPTDDDRIITY